MGIIGKTAVECPINGPLIIHHGEPVEPIPFQTPLLVTTDDGQKIVGTVSKDGTIKARAPFIGICRKRIISASIVAFLEVLACLELRHRTIAAIVMDQIGAVQIFDDYLG